MLWLLWCSIVMFYIGGIAVTAGFISKLGARDPSTIGSCYSGDYWLDFWLCTIWPLWWPAWGCFHVGSWLAKQGEHE